MLPFMGQFVKWPRIANGGPSNYYGRVIAAGPNESAVWGRCPHDAAPAVHWVPNALLTEWQQSGSVGSVLSREDWQRIDDEVRKQATLPPRFRPERIISGEEMKARFTGESPQPWEQVTMPFGNYQPGVSVTDEPAAGTFEPMPNTYVKIKTPSGNHVTLTAQQWGQMFADKQKYLADWSAEVKEHHKCRQALCKSAEDIRELKEELYEYEHGGKQYARINELEKENAELLAEVGRLQQTIDKQTKNISRAQKEIDELSFKNKQLQDNVDGLVREAQANDKRFATLTNTISERDEVIRQKNAAFDDSRRLHHQEVTRNASLFAQLREADETRRKLLAKLDEREVEFRELAARRLYPKPDDQIAIDLADGRRFMTKARTWGEKFLRAEFLEKEVFKAATEIQNWKAMVEKSERAVEQLLKFQRDAEEFVRGIRTNARAAWAGDGPQQVIGFLQYVSRVLDNDFAKAIR